MRNEFYSYTSADERLAVTQTIRCNVRNVNVRTVHPSVYFKHCVCLLSGVVGENRGVCVFIEDFSVTVIYHVSRKIYIKD